MLSILQTAVAFVLVLTLVVTILELGHFWAAKSFGVAIDRFSIGFGKAIASWTDKSGVQWRIGWAPVGGYVAFSGDDNAATPRAAAATPFSPALNSPVFMFILGNLLPGPGDVPRPGSTTFKSTSRG